VSAILGSDPCCFCADIRMERDTGCHYCGRSVHGDYECDGYLLAVTIGVLAAEVAKLISTLDDLVLRREIAEGACNGFTNAFYEHRLGATLSEDAFMDLCGCAREVTA